MRLSFSLLTSFAAFLLLASSPLFGQDAPGSAHKEIEIGILALEARAAIKSGDFALVEKQAKDLLQQSGGTPFDNNLFGRYLVTVNPPLPDDAYQQGLERWINQAPQSPIALLLHGTYYYEAAWFARGEDFADKVKASHMDRFLMYLKIARDDFLKSAQLDGTNPYSYLELIGIALGAGDESARQQAFENAIAKFPKYYPFYSARLTQLTPKWGGSLSQMIDFTFHYTTNLPENSPLRMLPAEMYFDLARDLPVNCGAENDPRHAVCAKQISDFMLGPDMQKKLEEAFDLRAHIDNSAFDERLLSIINCDCRVLGDPMIKFYELAQQKLGSGNFVVNYGSGNMYYLSNDAEHALPYLQASYNSVGTFLFSSEADKLHLRVQVDDKLADSYMRLNKLDEAKQYEDESIALNNNNSVAYEQRCNILLKLGLANSTLLDSALKDCNTSLSLRNFSYTLATRGNIYFQVGRLDEAATDYKAALALHDDQSEYIHDNLVKWLVQAYSIKNEPEKIIQFFNEDQSLMESANRPMMIGNYTARCNAYMRIDDFEDATKDCDQAIALGDAPMAKDNEAMMAQFRKQNSYIPGVAPFPRAQSLPNGLVPPTASR